MTLSRITSNSKRNQPQDFGDTVMVDIYFAGSIRGGRKDRDAYRRIIEHLKTKGKVLTEHVAAETIEEMGEEGLDSRKIHDRDMSWLKKCDLFIAEVSQPSLGVGYEISIAVSLGKKSLCLFRIEEGKELSAMIEGCPKVTLINYIHLDEALLAVDRFLAGEL